MSEYLQSKSVASENQVLCRINQTLGLSPEPKIEKERKSSLFSIEFRKNFH